MNRNRIIFSAYFVLIFLSTSVAAYSQNKSPCRNIQSVAKYQRAEIGAWAGKPDHFSGNVLVRPKDITPSFLTKLTKTIKAKYCNAVFVNVAIFDDSGLMDFGWEIYNKAQDDRPRERGHYTFDKVNGIDRIEYSCCPRGDVEQHKIDLPQ